MDYTPTNIDFHRLRHGNFLELLNLFTLEGAVMKLDAVILRGCSGWAEVWERLVAEWLPLLRGPQMSNLVMAGVPGMRSIGNLGSGAADLVLLPIEQYRRNGRMMRGLQLGAVSFAKAATLEAVTIGASLASGTKVLLEYADEIFSDDISPAEAQNADLTFEPIGGREVVLPPSNYQEGLQSAYSAFSQNVRSAAQIIFAVPIQHYEQTGPQGSIRSVIRAVPVAVLRPMIGASEAISRALLGFRSSMDPSYRADAERKYK